MKKAKRTVFTVTMLATMVTLAGCSENKGNLDTVVPETTVVTTVTEPSAEITMPATMECSETTDNTSSEEWRHKWGQLLNESTELLEGIKSEGLTSSLFRKLMDVQFEFEKLKVEAADFDDVDVNDDLEWYNPVVTIFDGHMYGSSEDSYILWKNGQFVLDAKYYRVVVWAQNVELDPNNEDFQVERHYTVQDPTRPAYMIIESAETPIQLYVIWPTE